MAEVDVSPAAHSAAVGDGNSPNPVKGNITRHDAQSPHPNFVSDARVNDRSSPPYKDASTDKISSRAVDPSSQPMSKVPSSSSHNESSKDEQSSGPAPYGTRSRNRPNALRPNYAEDQDVDFEISSLRPDTSRRSASHDSSSKSRAPSEAARPPTTLRLTTGPTKHSVASIDSSLTTEHSITNSPLDSQNEKKKRKVDRSAPPKPAAAGLSHALAREAIPGTSQFSAMPHSNIDAPPAKRRKTGEEYGNAPALTRRKGSLSHKSGPRETCLVTFDNTGAIMQNGKLIADDGTVYSHDDCVYLICEPPGDPYYLCRIMEFRTAVPEDPRSPVVSMLVNWFYRPRDISRYSSDARFLFASMQSDESPLSSLRGKCQIKHRTEIKDVEEYRRQRDSFWFIQLYDRYSHRPYEMIPSGAVINVPPNIKKAIDDQWKFLVVEPVRQKELTSAVKLCKRCGLYCAPEKSVDCGVCRDTYHMTCVNPPLSRKPSRGFAWSCGPCSRAQERKLEERHTTIIESDKDKSSGGVDEEDGDGEDPGASVTPPEPMNAGLLPEQPPEQAQVARSNMWPWRYLGVHCKVEDVLQYDDRAIYPRASSRLGTRHQAEVREWFGKPVELVEPLHLIKKYKGFGKGRDPKVSKEVQAQWQQEKAQQKLRPGYIQDQPPGYVARGEDYDENDPRCTATPLFVQPDLQPTSGFAAVNAKQPSDELSIDDYIEKVRKLASDWNLITLSKRWDPQISTNFLDQALRILSRHKFQTSSALQELSERHSPAILKNPDLNETEVKKFEDGVAKHGSDLRSVRRHVKTKPHGDIVRFYYTWKFTRRGDEIWGGHVGRKGVKRRAETSWADIADDEDDSAFDHDKALSRKRKFQCKHCNTRSSRQWRRAPNVVPGATILADPKGGKEKANQLVVALCQRCAVLWRRYAIIWSDPEEVARSFVQSGGRQWKKKQEEDWLREHILANEAAGVPTRGASASAALNMGIELTIPLEESAKKKILATKERDETPTGAQVTEVQKKKSAAPPPPPREPTPPIEPSPPRKRELPCAVCRVLDTPSRDVRLECNICRLNVHRNCYGITEPVNSTHWICDTCVNDKKQQFLLRYECAACTVGDRPVELFEPPKVSHKKKTDREREKERLEKVMVQTETDAYFKAQRKRGRPQYPREALKLTENSNWMHIICALWTPEIKFSDASRLQRAEGMAAVVNSPRTEQTCKLCRRAEKAVVTCQQCHAPFHPMCAHDAGYTFGFDVNPVKGSRKDSVPIVTLGSETGALAAAIWCKEHAPKTIVHDMTEVVDSETGMTALQLYADTYKQADLTLTGTARRANLLSQSAKTLAGSATSARRTSTLPNGTTSSTSLTNGTMEINNEDRRCKTCGNESSLKWHSVDDGQNLVNGSETRPPQSWQCHKCHMKGKQPPRSPSADPSSEVISKPLEDEPDLFRPKRSVWNTDPAGMQNLQHFADELRKTTIVVTNPKFGGLHVFQGKDFGLELDSDPRPAYRFIMYQASIKCGYDLERDVIITEDGSWVTFPKSMMQALVKMIVAGSREGHWRVVCAREVPCKLMQNVYIPPGPNRPGGVAPFPPHLTPPNFHTPQTARFPPPSSSSGPSSYPPVPAINGGPRSAMSDSFPRDISSSIQASMPGPYQTPNGVSASNLPQPPPGYQPAQPDGGSFLHTPPHVSPTSVSAATNGVAGSSSQRENASTGASASPSLQNLLRQ